MVDLKVECARLKELRATRPTEESREIAIRALESKFESIQVEGGKLLGQWGGRDAVQSLREWLLRTSQKPKAHAVLNQAVKAISHWIEPADAEWVLDLYFSRRKSSDAYYLIPLVAALPWKVCRSRVEAEIKSTQVVRRRAAALAVVRSSFPGRRELLISLKNHREPDIRSLAAWHLSHERAAV